MANADKLYNSRHTRLISSYREIIHQQNVQARYVLPLPVPLSSHPHFDIRRLQVQELLVTNSGLPSVCPSVPSSTAPTTAAQSRFISYNPIAGAPISIVFL